MFTKFLAAAALTVVSAADVPLFSSNDDYDEINLNIRMLSNHSAPAGTPTNVTVSTAMTGTFPAGTTVAKLGPGGAMYTDFNAGFSSYMLTISSGASACVVTAVGAGRRQLSESEAKRRLTVTLPIVVTSALTYASATAATAGAAAVNAATINTQTLANSFSGSLSGVTVSSATATATAPTTAAAPAAAPSPSPSSNAAKVAVSTLAALSAFVASLL